MEGIDSDDLVKIGMRSTREHEKKLKMTDCTRNMKNNRFHHRNIAMWNKLNDEMVCVKTIVDIRKVIIKTG